MSMLDYNSNEIDDIFIVLDECVNKFRVPVLMLKTITFESHNSESI